MRIIKIDDSLLAYVYSDIFKKYSGHSIPEEYFLKAKTYALITNKSEIVAGYSFQNYPFHKRIIHQIPWPSGWGQMGQMLELKYKSVEISGFFIKKGINPTRILIHLMINALTFWEDKFIYSYDVSNKHLENLYKKGNPNRIYSGKMQYIEDLTTDHIENVEILSKIGVCKIALNIIVRKFLNGFSFKKKIRSK